MFEILAADAMWEVEAVVGHLAILRRTDRPAVGPEEDGWWKQGYNAPLIARVEARGRAMGTRSGRLAEAGRRVARGVVPKRVRQATQILLQGAQLLGSKPNQALEEA